MKTNKIGKIISGITVVSMLCYTMPVMAYTKEETVYSKLDEKGETYQTIVSTHIKNTEESQILQDVSDLINLENTNGYETFEKDGPLYGRQMETIFITKGKVKKSYRFLAKFPMS